MKRKSTLKNRKIGFWLSDNEKNKKLLEKMWPVAPREEIMKAFPGEIWTTLCATAHRFKIQRKRRDEWIPAQNEVVAKYFKDSHNPGITDIERDKLRVNLIKEVNDISMKEGLKLRNWEEVLIAANQQNLSWPRSAASDGRKKNGGDSLEEKFIFWIKQADRTSEEVSNFLGLSTKKSLAFVDKMRAEGYPIAADAKMLKVSWQESLRDGLSALPPLSKQTFKMVTLSDISIGHRKQQLTLLHTLYKLINTGFNDKKKGVDFRDVNMVIVLGNLVADVRHSGDNEVFIEDSAEYNGRYIVEHFPKLLGGIKTYVLNGPAELSLNKPKKRNGVPRDVLQGVCWHREDMVYLGSLSHTVKITGTDAEVYLAHTSKKRSQSLYTKSVPLQYVQDSFNDLSSLRKGKKRPVVSLLGGHHVFMLDPPTSAGKERHTLLVPSFCDPVSSVRDRERQGATPTIGFVITTINFDNERKNIISVKHEPHFWTNHQIDSDYLETKIGGEGENFLNENQSKVISWLEAEQRVGLTAGEISRRLNIPKVKTHEIMESLSKDNLVYWDEAKKRYFVNMSRRKKFGPVQDIGAFVNTVYNKTVKRGIYSDTHVGSIEEQPHAIREVERVFMEHGIKHLLHCGDVYDGENLYGPKHKRNLYLFSAKAQRQRAVEALPKIPGSVTHFIGGSHDQIFETQAGDDSLASIVRERPDMVFLGHDEGISLDPETGIRHMLFHPSGGVPKGKSYRLQEAIRQLSECIDNRDEDIQGIFVGHLHIALAMFWRGVFCLLVPCLQGRTEYLVKKGLYPRLGCWVMEQSVDEQNDPTRVLLNYHAINPKEYQVIHKLVPKEEQTPAPVATPEKNK